MNLAKYVRSILSHTLKLISQWFEGSKDLNDPCYQSILRPMLTNIKPTFSNLKLKSLNIYIYL